MLLLSVPFALLAIAVLLFLASHLEQSRVRVLVRLTMRSNASPEITEAIVANELEAVLVATGLANRIEPDAA